ncbi:family 1 encapsulin nanocompartment shell protein [Tissierella sp. Yu-01]|uniref:family 1 encapsulin nanocompartment shell protein n=1 Tax=Tissierella sp. Yu-01 TaxID=3035694 RepID=UPI00240DB56A|nr:family 1 encapsulin nanocompartment shell protein [Tissierella sp. Yu-01]WFA08263.1 family 1 encapsulin nanocompartment shell protein [Tissierella sp. Yu-01]
MLYRELAPISNEAWNEIDERAEEVLKSYLSARKVVKVNGPKGLDFNVITEGRLTNIHELENKLCYGTYQVQPLTETRVEFEMSRWELDNIARGAKDVDYEPLEISLKEIALLEENAIYNGLEKAMIKGIDQYSKVTIPFGNDPTSIMEGITKAIIQLKKDYESGPFTLVVSEEAYKRILSKETAYPLDERIEKLIGGKIVFSHVINGAYLLPYDHDDLELTIGRDFSIGYQSHDAEKIRFFATESFTFRVLNPDLIVKFTI